MPPPSAVGPAKTREAGIPAAKTGSASLLRGGLGVAGADVSIPWKPPWRMDLAVMVNQRSYQVRWSSLGGGYD